MIQLGMPRNLTHFYQVFWHRAPRIMRRESRIAKFRTNSNEETIN